MKFNLKHLSILLMIEIYATLLFSNPRRIHKEYRMDYQLNLETIGTSSDISNSFTRSFVDEKESLYTQLSQSDNGRVIRPYLPTTLKIILDSSKLLHAENAEALLEQTIQYFLDSGGRLRQLFAKSTKGVENLMVELGFDSMKNDVNTEEDIGFIISANKLKDNISKRLVDGQHILPLERKAILYNIIGRLNHDLGDFKAAIEAYTQSLILNPKATNVFRNLGSAYHADGNTQMAYASYQQVISLDPEDAFVYLKMAFLYEDLAQKDWQSSFENAVKCYRHYLEKVDPEDTVLLTRLGNLLMKGNLAEEALEVYNKILVQDPSQHTVWFNSAHGYLKLGQAEQAIKCLHKTLEGDPKNAAAKHMLSALDEESAVAVREVDLQYVRELFDSYAETYEKHFKKLKYATPRVIRSELATLFKTQYEAAIATKKVNMLTTPFLDYMKDRLDILDLGCGTGLVGRWLKDYARTLVGVDISPAMIEKARNKVIYTDLIVQDLTEYLMSVNLNGRQFGMVTAGDVFSYIGDLEDTIQEIIKAIRSNGYFVCSIETLLVVPPSNSIESNGFRLLPSGRFAYSKPYVNEIVDKVAKNIGVSMKLIIDKEFTIRYDLGEPVPGNLFVFQRLP